MAQMTDDHYIRFMEASTVLLDRFDMSMKIHGVSLLPVQLSQDGKVEALLGKEKGGQYRGQLNMFGGKLQNQYNLPWIAMTNEQRFYAVMNTLYSEVYEEMGIKLDPTALTTSLINVYALPTNTGASLIFVIRIEGYTPVDFDRMMQDRLKQNVRGYLREMTELVAVSGEMAPYGYYLSRYYKSVMSVFPNSSEVASVYAMANIVTSEGDVLPSRNSH